jgi:60 kDa SS-A/Ro ribonucleoprotein
VVAGRLRDVEVIKKVRVFPYQVMMTDRAVGRDVPRPIVDALHDALEASLENVPIISGQGTILVFPDVSGSMTSPVTGFRRGATSAVRCVDVAALFSAAVLRQNPDAVVVPVDTMVHTDFRAEPRDSVMTNATRLATYGGGGTALSAALAWANAKKVDAEAVIMISDYESWADPHSYGCNRTALMGEWRKLRSRCPQAKLVCIDIQPYRTTQTPDLNSEVLNIAGFNDSCFSAIESFLNGDPRSWIDSIDRVVLE